MHFLARLQRIKMPAIGLVTIVLKPTELGFVR